MRSLPRFSIKNPVTVSMIVLAVLLLGFISYSRLGTNLMPEIDNPRLFVDIDAGERPPAEIEKQLVVPIEALVVRQKGVANVESGIMAGRARLTISYSWDSDMDQAFLELQKVLSPYSNREDVEELKISRFNPNADPVVQIALYDSLGPNLNQLRLLVENVLRPELVRLEGVADVALAGEREFVVEVQANSSAMSAFGITLEQIAGKINDFNQNVSGGYIEEKGQRYVVRGSSAISKPSDIESLVIKMAGTDRESGNAGSPVLLKDIADIRIMEDRPSSMVSIDGEDCLGLYIYKENRYNTVEMTGSVFETLNEFSSNHPGIKMELVENQGEFIEASVAEVSESAMLGILFAVVVLFLFLRNWGATLVVSIAIPLSVVATFGLMYFNDLTLNLMTLGGLALGAGMLVDNAIIVLENIYRLLEKGKSLKDAAIEGAGSVGGAIVASTLTTVVVFLPIVYLQGVSGEFFKDQAWTVAFSLFCSLGVALMVVPLLSTKLIGRKRSVATSKPLKWGFYHKILRKALDHKGFVLIAAVLLMAGSYALLPFVGSSFLPDASSDELEIEVTLPPGTRLESTNETLLSVSQSIRQIMPEGSLRWIYAHSGPAVTESGQSFSRRENEGFLKVAFSEVSKSASGVLASALDSLFAGVNGLELHYGQTEPALQSLSANDESPFVLEVRGADADVLKATTSEIADMLSKSSDLINVFTSFEEEAPEIDIRIDRMKAGMLGLSIQSIISQVQASLQKQDAGSIEESGNRTEIKVSGKELNIVDLASLEIVNGDAIYRLNELARIEVGHEPGEILRDNQSRVGKVYAGVLPGEPFDKVVERVEALVADMAIPPGYRVEVTGDEQRRKESFSQLLFALMLSVVLVYMVMAAQFESLIHPFTILLTIPLAGVGTILTFLLLGISFNIMAFIGVVMLGGIAVNDSIILVDAINQYKTQGLQLREAVLNAARDRLRPILMTSLTTMLALFPLALSIGRSASLRSPLAIAVIAGLFTSTLLTLVVIPCVYELFDRDGRKQRRAI
ncbi:efflux RND transporter permease subunit [Marinilabilia salmonicolor]|uniref:HAE1 family hydrophobic/amphiphilic exporter-1 n=1 Tax=Marinilabilia salmonicolor TaxID=989 RepID=A0A368VAZ2_9BACT|nr:efflux RND transporter permease subunit [Marinilabilia salmonicolor]RCW38417.1 HAE1 family hydrophobic/amphiphilic exporter-1 [Marinilabilia salmonicolor]